MGLPCEKAGMLIVLVRGVNDGFQYHWCSEWNVNIFGHQGIINLGLYAKK